MYQVPPKVPRSWGKFLRWKRGYSESYSRPVGEWVFFSIVYVCVRVYIAVPALCHMCPSPSGMAVSFLRAALEGARLLGPGSCSGDFTMDNIIICCRVDVGAACWPCSRALYCRAAERRGCQGTLIGCINDIPWIYMAVSYVLLTMYYWWWFMVVYLPETFFHHY